MRGALKPKRGTSSLLTFRLLILAAALAAAILTPAWKEDGGNISAAADRFRGATDL